MEPLIGVFILSAFAGGCFLGNYFGSRRAPKGDDRCHRVAGEIGIQCKHQQGHKGPHAIVYNGTEYAFQDDEVLVLGPSLLETILGKDHNVR